MTLWEFTRLLAINDFSVFSKLLMLKKLFFPRIRLCPKFKNEKRIVSIIPAFQQFLCECLQPVFYSLHLSFIDCLSGIVEYFNFESWLGRHGILRKIEYCRKIIKFGFPKLPASATQVSATSSNSRDLEVEGTLEHA